LYTEIKFSDQVTTGQNYKIKIGNKSLELVEQLKDLGTTLTNKNSIHEEIKRKLKSGSACYY
jgi:hypothetical protein